MTLPKRDPEIWPFGLREKNCEIAILKRIFVGLTRGREKVLMKKDEAPRGGHGARILEFWR
jgi:hypothetical protein